MGQQKEDNKNQKRATAFLILIFLKKFTKEEIHMSRYRACRRKREYAYSEELGCLTAIILMIIAMPIGGLFLLFTGKSSLQRVLGAILTVLGIVVWVGLG